MKSPLPLLPALLAGLAAPAIAASFDCNQARTPVERAICADPSLSAMDEQMVMLFERAKQNGEPAKVISWQKTWLKERRNTCKDLACLKLQYQLQLHLLSVKSRLVINALLEQFRLSLLPFLQRLNGRKMIERTLRNLLVVRFHIAFKRRLQLSR